MDTLPNEMLWEIVERVPLNELNTLACVNSVFNVVASKRLNKIIRKLHNELNSMDYYDLSEFRHTYYTNILSSIFKVLGCVHTCKFATWCLKKLYSNSVVKVKYLLLATLLQLCMPCTSELNLLRIWLSQTDVFNSDSDIGMYLYRCLGRMNNLEYKCKNAMHLVILIINTNVTVNQMQPWREFTSLMRQAMRYFLNEPIKNDNLEEFKFWASKLKIKNYKYSSGITIPLHLDVINKKSKIQEWILANWEIPDHWFS